MNLPAAQDGSPLQLWHMLIATRHTTGATQHKNDDRNETRTKANRASKESRGTKRQSRKEDKITTETDKSQDNEQPNKEPPKLAAQGNRRKQPSEKDDHKRTKTENAARSKTKHTPRLIASGPKPKPRDSQPRWFRRLEANGEEPFGHFLAAPRY